MTDTFSGSSRSYRAQGLLAAAFFAVALLAVACGTSGKVPLGVPHARPAVGSPGELSAQGPLDTSDPTIGRLDPDLLAALQDAARDARRDGVRVEVTSGWRSRAHQERLFEEAVSKYGSEEEALRYVATPDTSAHVTGDAVDIGPTEADDWMIRNGADYGLCQTFANEMWHFELATSPGGQCPEMLPDGSARS